MDLMRSLQKQCHQRKDGIWGLRTEAWDIPILRGYENKELGKEMDEEETERWEKL
jgi:hypothetical protein